MARTTKEKAMQKISYHMNTDEPQFLSDDHFDQEENDLEASSVPLEGYAEETKGFQPRSRLPVSRESQSRRKTELLSRFANDYTQQFKGRLHINPEDIPTGHSIFWGAKSVKGHGRQEKLTKLYEEGFFPATAEDFPKRAYRDYYGEIDDSMDIIDCGANTLLLRDNDINKAHIKHFEKVSDQNQSPVRKAQKDALNPYGNIQQNNNQFFPELPEGNGLTSSYIDQ